MRIHSVFSELPKRKFKRAQQLTRLLKNNAHPALEWFSIRVGGQRGQFSHGIVQPVARPQCLSSPLSDACIGFSAAPKPRLESKFLQDLNFLRVKPLSSFLFVCRKLAAGRHFCFSFFRESRHRARIAFCYLQDRPNNFCSRLFFE